VEVHHSKRRFSRQAWGEGDVEREVRQALADKVCGNLVGIWLLVPEHLRLGTWDLLGGWAGRGGNWMARRLAMQLVHESALCVNGIRAQRVLNHRGFELANGLPFVATDGAIHQLLDAHSVRDAQRLQAALGQLRKTMGHFRGRLLALDPHRMPSYSKRRMRKRKAHPRDRAVKMAQTFFCLDADTAQPICAVTGTSARTVSAATPELLLLAEEILDPESKPLAVADCEHFSMELLRDVRGRGRFDLLVPMPKRDYTCKRLQSIDPELLTPRWAGYATARVPYNPCQQDFAPPLTMMVQRSGEPPQDCALTGFVCTDDRPEVQALCEDFPKRWHVEEFFNAHQALGWQRAGTQNLNIRYGRMSLALIAQTALHQLRQHLDAETAAWDARHFAQDFLGGLEGDVRVQADTIVVTYYNAPQADLLQGQYAHLPKRLEAEGIDPRIPWLYDLKLDFRFK